MKFADASRRIDRRAQFPRRCKAGPAINAERNRLLERSDLPAKLCLASSFPVLAPSESAYHEEAVGPSPGLAALHRGGRSSAA